MCKKEKELKGKFKFRASDVALFKAYKIGTLSGLGLTFVLPALIVKQFKS